MTISFKIYIMKIVFYFTYLLFSTLNVYIYTKNVYDSDIKFSGEDKESRSHLVKRKPQSYDRLYGINSYKEQLDAELTDQNLLNAQSNQRRRRIDDSLITGLYGEQDNGRRLLSTRLSKRSLEGSQSKEPYGLVYRKGRLLGILEPYSEFYEISPYSNMRESFEELQSYPAIQSEENVQYSSNRRPSYADMDDSEKDESSQSDLSGYTNDKYPMILANFKIDKKLNANKREKMPLVDKIKVKHSMLDNTYSKAIEKKSIFNLDNDKNSHSALTKSNNEDSPDKVDAIEDDLRKILNDMGLIEGDLMKNKRDNNKIEKIEKRDVTNEDENLEEGSNKIDIVKATHDPEKSDRIKRTEEMVENNQDDKLTDDEQTNEGESKREIASSNIHNYQHEGELYVRSKRNEVITENSDIMKGLEKSGDLTVSGNKSPLAISENELKTTEKRKNSEENLKASKKNEDYEKQLELHIQQKINAIKEEVKREIASLQRKSLSQTQTVEDAERRKRETANTLLEGKLKTLNPQNHPEGYLLPYIRVKRNSKKVKPHKRLKRDLEELKNFRNFDYFINMDNTQDEDKDINDDYYLKKKRSINNTLPVKESVSNTYISETVEHPVSVSNDKQIEEKLKIQDNVKTNNKENIKFVTTVSNLVRKERFSSNNLEALQTQASFGLTKVITNYPKMQRQRRQIGVLQNVPTISHLRKKRGEAIMPDGNIAYLGYRGEDNDVDEEGDEFEDDGFDDRSAGMHKRDINNIQDYQGVMDYEISNNGYGANQIQKYPSRKFVPNLNSDVYEHSLRDLMANNYLSYDPSAYIRKKRHNFDQLVSLHGGGPMLRHLSAVRERNMRQLDSESRSRRNHQQPSKIVENNKNDQQNIAELSDIDLFGALPQSYEGELSRFKRVKRSASTSPVRENKSTRKLK